MATTRVRCREDILILRPFPLWLYKRGPSDSPSLLLRTLRGEEIDCRRLPGFPQAQRRLQQVPLDERLHDFSHR